MSTQAPAAPLPLPWYQNWKRLAMNGGAVMILLIYWTSYSGLVSGDEAVKQTASQVQNVMQRQADLIPNIVETVKAEAKFESDTLTKVIDARASATRPVQLASGGSCAPVRDNANPSSVPPCDPSKLSDDPAAQRAFAAAQQAMLSFNVNALREAYPTLRANDAFRNLTAELAGSQNRIAVARRDNQIATQNFNRNVRTPPAAFIASYHGFVPKPYFEAAADAQVVPKVKF